MTLTPEEIKQIEQEAEKVYPFGSDSSNTVMCHRQGYEECATKYLLQLKEERERAGKMVEELRGAVESMIYQYGYRTVYDGQPAIGTGGMSALEAAFWAIGWADDPHIIPEDGNTCEIQGCMKDPSSGQRWGDLYLSLCSDHSRMLRDGKDRPDVKEYAIKREATRDKVTGYLPFNKPQ